MKKSLVPALILLLLLFLFPALSVKGAKDGLLLWFNTVIPTLFPFILLTNILRELDGIEFFQKCFGRIIEKVFHTSGSSSYAVISGLLCGYPMGAKTTADTYSSGYISKSEANYLLSFCNNPSPMFVINFIILATLGEPQLVVPFFIIIYLSAYLCSVLNYLFLRRHQNNSRPASHHVLKVQQAGAEKSGFIDGCIINSFELLCKIGGYLILFSMLSQYVLHLPVMNDFIKIIICGLLEQTTGISLLGAGDFAPEIKIALTMAFTCFGGLAITAQTYSVIHQQGLSLKKYILNKCITAAFAVILVTIYLKLIY